MKIILISALLIFWGLNSYLWANEWDDHEVQFTQKFIKEKSQLPTALMGMEGPTENWETSNWKKTLTLSADRINILVGAFGEIDIKIAELKIMPYVEFRLQKQKPKK